MNASKSISKVFESAEQIPFDDSSRIVLISDCHRGDGSWADAFSKNQNLFFAALSYYYNENYIYIELGDGDELWENKRIYDIMDVHSDAFKLMSRFFDKDRLYFIFGNHDMAKKNDKFVKNNFYNYFDEREQKYIPLFKNVKIHEGLILRHTYTEGKIYLIHGHQADFFNYKLWRLSKFLVKYVWRTLGLFGINNPTSAARNTGKTKSVGRKLTEWAKTNNQILIAGHTHRPVFPEAGAPMYFNDGSCVHPHGITAIEIADGSIRLVKWGIKTKKDGTLFVDREEIAGPKKLKDFWGGKQDDYPYLQFKV